MIVPENIFRQYDIRGIYGDDLTCEVAEGIARAFAAYLVKELKKTDLTVSIGRDVRKSSGALRDALIKGLTSSGVNCVDIGECPTPLQYFSLQSLELDGGIMITGSHNPPEYNGFKLSAGKETIHGSQIQTIKKLLKNESQHVLPTGTSEGTTSECDIISLYNKDILERFSAIKEAGTKLKVVVDSGNGTGGPVAPHILRELGADVVELFCEVDGNFPNHHPDPTVEENLVDLKAKIAETGADFGVAYDGDADRIGIVDEKGSVVWGDQLMIIYGRDIITKNPGATIVGEVKCSQVLYDEIAKAGGNPVMWKTGHSLIKSKMKELKAAMAGEMSGHIFFADRYYGFDDAIYATVRAYEILAKKRAENPDFGFSELLSGIAETHSTPEIRIDCPDSEKFHIVKELSDKIKDGAEGLAVSDVVTIDGLRANFEGGWALARASNTQPALVMRFEADSPERLAKFQAFVKEKLSEVSSECVIPW